MYALGFINATKMNHDEWIYCVLVTELLKVLKNKHNYKIIINYWTILFFYYNVVKYFEKLLYQS